MRDTVSSLSFCMHMYISTLERKWRSRVKSCVITCRRFACKKCFTHKQKWIYVVCTVCRPRWLRIMIKASHTMCCCSTWQRQKLVRMLCAMRENQHKNQKLKLCIDEVYGGGEQLSLFAFCFHDCVVLYLQGTISPVKYSHTVLDPIFKTAIFKLCIRNL